VLREPSGEGRHRDLRTPPKRNHSEGQEKFPSNFYFFHIDDFIFESVDQHRVDI
jgi:hypothetical protein